MLLPASEILKLGWNQYTKHLNAFREPIVWMMVPAVISAMLPIIPGTTQGTSLLIGLISFCITVWAVVQIIDISWALHEGKAPASALTRSLAWGPIGRIIDFVLVYVLYNLVTLIGFFLLLIPGVVFKTWFSFSPVVTLLEGAHGTGSLRRSKDLVDGRFWSILWRWIVIRGVPGILLITGLVALTFLAGAATGNLEAFKEASELPWWTNALGEVLVVLALPYFFITEVILFAEARKSR